MHGSQLITTFSQEFSNIFQIIVFSLTYIICILREVVSCAMIKWLLFFAPVSANFDPYILYKCIEQIMMAKNAETDK